MRYSKKYILGLTETVLSQISNEVGASVIMSWGVRSIGGGVVKNNDAYELPCVILEVSGLMHTGLVVIAYNEGADTYEVQLRNTKGEPVGDWHVGAYFDCLGSLIDSLVERPSDMSDEDYEMLSTLDSYIKELESCIK